MDTRTRCCHLAVIATFAVSTVAFGEDTNEKTLKQKVVDHWMQVSLDHAKTYSISPVDDPSIQFEMVDHAVFQHTQVVRPPADDIGAIYLWVDRDSRPAAVGTVFCWSTSESTRMLCNEFHSLSDVPIVTTQAGNHLWKSRIAGTQWQPVPDAPDPGKTPRRRRIQAKLLAKQFNAYMIDGQKKRWDLRNIPSPIYEYDVKSTSERGGAVFVFCRATDVEAVLFLEVRDSKPGPRWEFTCGQFTDNEPHMTFAGKEVWELFEDAHSKDGNPHFLRMIGNRPKPKIEQELAASK